MNTMNLIYLWERIPTSATTISFQPAGIISALLSKHAGTIRNLDINSGFDDRIFIKSPDKYWELYRQLKLECWRFAYDSADQKEAITGIARYLTGKGVDYRHMIVFCLAGGPGTSFADSRQRLQYLIDIGCSPYPCGTGLSIAGNDLYTARLESKVAGPAVQLLWSAVHLAEVQMGTTSAQQTKRGKNK